MGGCGGAGARLAATPVRVDLGEIPFEGKPSLVNIAIENRATSPVLVEFFRIDGDTPAHVAPRVSTCATGKPLAAEASCSVVVMLQADRFGSMTGQLVVGYQGPGSPLTVTVVATGGGRPDLRVMTSRLDFASRNLVGRAESAPIILSSRGTAAAWLDEYTIEGPGARSFRINVAGADCSLSEIHPGTTCHLPIVFHPLTATRLQATLVLTTKVIDSSGAWQSRVFRVPLSGVG